MHAQIFKKLEKKRRRSPYQYFSTTYEMPLVISCRILGKGITTSVPTKCEIHTDERTKWKSGHGSLLAIAKPSFIVSPRADSNALGLTIKRIKSHLGFYPFYWFVSSFSFFSFLPDIHWMEEPYSVHVFTCIPHMFWNVHVVMHFFLHDCILLYVHKTNQRSNYVNLSFVYLWNHSPVTFFLFVVLCFIFGKNFIFFTFYLFVCLNLFSCIK